MYYDFFCNEKMLLDNHEKYNISNRTMRRLLGQSDIPPDKCADIYLDNLKKFDDGRGLYFDRYDLIQQFEEYKCNDRKLLEVNEIKVYKQDLEYIKKQIEEYDLTQREQLCLFGVAMMCRILNTDTIDLTTQFKIKQFCGCFDGRIWDTLYDTGKWYNSYHAPCGMDMISDTYNILTRTSSESGAGKIGCYYTYHNYELSSRDVVLEYAVTPENNRLDLFDVYQRVGLKYIRFCTRCGDVFYSRSGVAKYCECCNKEVKRQQTRERVRRWRSRS